MSSWNRQCCPLAEPQCGESDHLYVAPQEADVDPELAELAADAAGVVVKALATAAWKQATTAVGGLWRRGHPERVDTMRAELEETRTRCRYLAARAEG